MNKRFDIPKRLTLHGQEIEIEYKDSILEKDDTLGEARFREGKIVIYSNSREVYKKQRIEQVFFHELVHFILNEMSEHDLVNNEKFVDLFGSLLHQAVTSFEYEKSKE